MSDGDDPLRFTEEALDELRAEHDALAKRVEELETMLANLYAEEVGSQRQRSYFPAANALWNEAKAIATRRAGRASS